MFKGLSPVRVDELFTLDGNKGIRCQCLNDMLSDITDAPSFSKFQTLLDQQMHLA